jgi:hypothetical protein
LQLKPAAALATPVVVSLESSPIDKTRLFDGLSIKDRPDGSRKRDRDSDICQAFLKIQADRQNSDALQRAQQARQRAEHAAGWPSLQLKWPSGVCRSDMYELVRLINNGK